MAPSRGRSHHRHLLHPPFPPLLPLLLLSLLLLALPSTHAAPSTADLLTYLGGSATGQSFTIPAGYTLTVAANEEKVLISASFDGKKASEVGWVGFGVGSAMTDADIVVCWPTVDGETLTWTLSHRTATSTVMPTLVGSANADDPSSDSTGALKIVAELSSAGGDETPAVVTWERALAMEEGYEGGENYQLEARINQQFIYAYGEDNPGDAAQDTDFKQHSLDAMGGAYVDLSASFTADTAAIDPPLTPLDESESGGGGDDEEAMTTADGTGGAGGSSKTETGSGGGATGTGTATATSGGEETGAGGGGSTATGTGTKTAGGSTATGGSSSTGGTGGTSGAGGTFSYSTVILIHGVCAGACWGFLAPMGVLFARYGRGPPGTTLTKFPWHFTMQGWVVTPLTFIAGGLALWAVSLKSSTSSEPFAHKTLGFIFLGGLALQDLLGLLKHFVKTPGASPQRGLLGWCHIMLGVTLIAVGFVQVKLGIERYGADDVVLYGLYGCIALFALAYFGSLLKSLVSTPPAPPSPPAPRRSRSSHRHRPHHAHAASHRRHHRAAASRSHERLRGANATERRQKHRRRREEKDRFDDDDGGSTSGYDSEDSLYSEDEDVDSLSSGSGERREGRRRRRRGRRR